MLHWLLPRLLLALAALAVGTIVGLAVGERLGAGWLGQALGSALGILAWMVGDALRAGRLLAWLRGEQAEPAPREGGLWAELAYRSERAVRARDKALATERRRLADFLSAIDASPNGVLLLDEKRQLTWSNQQAALLLGLHAQRDLGQRLTNLVRAPAFVGHLQSGRWDEPVTMPRPGGDGTLQVLLRSHGDGQVLVLVQDVTERLRADAMRRDFVANVSHEIRSPLTVLAGFVETMRSLALSEAERQRVYELMQQQTDRMQVLVADLLTLAQLEGSPRPGSERWVQLPALMQRVAADTERLSAGRHTVVLQPGPALQLAGLESELLSAAGNLASNAVRYTPEGGRIELSWSRRPDGSVAVEVRDSGIGIAREHLPRLTERFYRVDGSRSRDTGGTGLGLAIVKHVVQRHDGELEIDSAPGLGARFRLVFPAARVRSADADAAAMAAA